MKLPHLKLQELSTSCLHQQRTQLTMQQRDTYADIDNEEEELAFFYEALQKQVCTIIP